MATVRIYESAESASPVITRLVAGVLTGRPSRTFHFAPWERLGMRLLNLLPIPFAQRVVRWQFSRSALPPEIARQIKLEDLIQQRLDDYRHIQGPFPVVVSGSALAGATAHIASLLGGPYIPQPFILGLHGGSPDESIEPHLELTSSVAVDILDRNPGICAIAHFDPVHDGWLTRTVSHLRIKLLELPRAYQTFIHKHLTPGGTILYLDCQAQWPQFPLGERFNYQIGGWGGIPPEEFLSGSERINQFLRASGSSHSGGWRIENVDPVWGPESEWGSNPGLDASLQMFADENGYDFVKVTLPHPHDFSRLVFEAHRMLLAQEGKSASGLLVETFTQYDPYLVLQAGLLPLWLVFNTTDSLAFLQETLVDIPRDVRIFFSGLVTFSRTPDMVPWEVWASALHGRPWLNIGAGPRRYPEDLVALFRWSERLRKHLNLKHENTIPRLSIKTFLSALSTS